MSKSDIETEFENLTPAMKEKVFMYIKSLKNEAAEESLSKYRGFGALKGKIKMGEDFDEPLEDFKDYM